MQWYGHVRRRESEKDIRRVSEVRVEVVWSRGSQSKDGVIQ